jgi:hypothetical protein
MNFMVLMIVGMFVLLLLVVMLVAVLIRRADASRR